MIETTTGDADGTAGKIPAGLALGRLMTTVAEVGRAVDRGRAALAVVRAGGAGPVWRVRAIDAALAAADAAAVALWAVVEMPGELAPPEGWGSPPSDPDRRRSGSAAARQHADARRERHGRGRGYPRRRTPARRCGPVR